MVGAGSSGIEPTTFGVEENRITSKIRHGTKTAVPGDSTDLKLGCWKLAHFT
jgi:hypothetical protein